MDESAVYVAPADADELWSLELRTLILRSKRIYRSPLSAVASANGNVWVRTTQGTSAFGFGANFPASRSALLAPYFDRADYGGGLPERTADGWLVDGVVYAPDNWTRVVRVVAPPGLTFKGGKLATVLPGAENPSPATWGLTLRDETVMAGREVVFGPSKEQLPKGVSSVQAVALLPDRPVAAVVRAVGGLKGPNHRIQSVLLFRELLTGKAVERQVLTDGLVAKDARFEVVARPGRVVVRCGDRLFAVPTADLDAKKLPVPLHVEAPDGVRLVSTGKVSLAAPEVKGGTAPVEFSMPDEIAGLSLDGNGVLTIDADALAKRIAEKPMPEDAWGAKFCEALTGSKPKNMAVWVAVPVVARDAKKRETATTLGFYLDVPAGRKP